MLDIGWAENGCISVNTADFTKKLVIWIVRPGNGLVDVRLRVGSKSLLGVVTRWVAG